MPAIVFGNATKPSRFAHFWQGSQSLAPATRKHICTSKSAPYPRSFLHFWLRNVLRATTVYTFSTSQLPKVVLYILTSKCASRHNGVHFFDVSTSKSGPNLVCFVHFDFEMCFAPQRRALFRHLNFKKCPEREVFLAFSFANVLRATTACNFASLIWPAGSAPAALASLLFDPPEPLWKHTVFRDFSTFSHTSIFFLLDLLSSETFSFLRLCLFWSSSFFFLLLFSSLLFVDSYHLCFSFVNIVGSLTFKLPSIIFPLTHVH